MKKLLKKDSLKILRLCLFNQWNDKIFLGSVHCLKSKIKLDYLNIER